MTPAPLDHLLALAMIGGPLVSGLRFWRGRRDPGVESMTSGQRVAMYWSNAVLMAVLAGAVVAFWLTSERSLEALGLTLQLHRPATGLGLAGLFLVLYGIDTWWQVSGDRLAATRARWRRETPFMPTGARELAHSWVMVLAASVGEEILFRGYLIAYLVAILGGGPVGLSAAVGIPAVAFAIAHLYQRWASVAKIVLLSVIFGAILVVTGSLLIPMILHFVVDATGVLLAPWLLAEERPEQAV